MALTLYSLFKAALLVLNALAVLHPHRFLAKRACYCGECAPRRHGTHLPTTQSSPHPRHADGLDKVQDGTGMRAQLAGLLHAVRFMRCACPWWLSDGCMQVARTAITHQEQTHTPRAGPLLVVNVLIIVVELLVG